MAIASMRGDEMAFHNIVPEYVFIIDTDQYAGNFERQMVGYITGQYGECEVGEEEAQLFWDHFDGDDTLVQNLRFGSTIFDGVTPFPDEHGCNRPATIWPTPHWFNDGMGGHYQDGQEKEAQEKYIEKCIQRANDPGSLHPNNHQEHKERWLKMSQELMVKHPAYQSVAVLWNKKPCPKAIDIMMGRAIEFCIEYVPKSESVILKHLSQIKIIGFRLIQQKITTTLIKEWT